MNTNFLNNQNYILGRTEKKTIINLFINRKMKWLQYISLFPGLVINIIITIIISLVINNYIAIIISLILMLFFIRRFNYNKNCYIIKNSKQYFVIKNKFNLMKLLQPELKDKTRTMPYNIIAENEYYKIKVRG